MKKKERLMGITMSLIISAAMGILAAFIILKTNPMATQGSSPLMIYIVNIVLSMIVGLFVALFIPLGRLGRRLTIKAGANPPGLKFTLINCIPISSGNTVIVSIIVSLIGVVTARSKMSPEVLSSVPPFPVMWIGSWLRLFIPTLIVSYILAIVLSPVLARAFGINGARSGDSIVGPVGGTRPPQIDIGKEDKDEA
ncbi:MAG: hypothetical protein J5685_05890 [Clostridiales bacterium]|nr:hypothetical protein [Clostridiales bacterium]